MLEGLLEQEKILLPYDLLEVLISLKEPFNLHGAQSFVRRDGAGRIFAALVRLKGARRGEGYDND